MNEREILIEGIDEIVNVLTKIKVRLNSIDRPPEEVLDKFQYALNVRAMNALGSFSKRYGFDAYHCPQKLIGIPEYELKRSPGVGKKTLRNIKNALKEAGLL